MLLTNYCLLERHRCNYKLKKKAQDYQSFLTVQVEVIKKVNLYKMRVLRKLYQDLQTKKYPLQQDFQCQIKKYRIHINSSSQINKKTISNNRVITKRKKEKNITASNIQVARFTVSLDHQEKLLINRWQICLLQKQVNQVYLQIQQLNFYIFQSESKNLKRRVYDSINVMVALGVLEKQKKIITKGSMFQQNHMTSRYVRDVRDKYEMLRQQQFDELKRKKMLFQKLTDQAKRINALIDLNKQLQKDESDFIQGQQSKIYQFPIMIFKLPQNAKLNIIQIDGKSQIQIRSDHEIQIVGDYDILPLIKRVEEAKDKIIPGPMLNL
ncbi:unnamed protein product [Paramecium sonneborni]|uniref:E2F/DP family winged-helix DNA-binding domain-containing protein n=1 Tax=Paramecium sonneborni TaxID=65129 RepID=A0A8S1P226_9CILI|nr:unnamed protein product [Paramecium sonneborni]